MNAGRQQGNFETHAFTEYDAIVLLVRGYRTHACRRFWVEGASRSGEIASRHRILAISDATVEGYPTAFPIELVQRQEHQQVIGRFFRGLGPVHCHPELCLHVASQLGGFGERVSE